MRTQMLAGLIAVALLAAYLGPIVFKMKDAALAIVIVVGIVLMLVDLWQSLREDNH